MQPSLFTRLTVVEDELSAMKGVLAELQVSQEELQRDRDEWRWRAEHLLAEVQRGMCWRWYNWAAEAFDAVTARFQGLLGDVRKRLSDLKAG